MRIRSTTTKTRSRKWKWDHRNENENQPCENQIGSHNSRFSFLGFSFHFNKLGFVLLHSVLVRWFFDLESDYHSFSLLLVNTMIIDWKQDFYQRDQIEIFVQKEHLYVSLYAPWHQLWEIACILTTSSSFCDLLGSMYSQDVRLHVRTLTGLRFLPTYRYSPQDWR
jgi:hypothetical protein